MSIAIIAEYNPFHNGHIFQLEYAQKHFPNEEIIVIMSGKYVQRGEIAIASFQERTKFAKQYGANKVIELPFLSATQAAHIFAQGAIEIVHREKISKILFGSENGEIDFFWKIAHGLKNNKKEFNVMIKKFLKTGLSYPKANNETLKSLLNVNVENANDILGLEYVKAIVNNNFLIKPFTLKRTIGHHATVTTGQFASASYLRKMIYQKDLDYQKFTPMRIQKFDRIENHYCEFQKIINNLSIEELQTIKLMSEGLEKRFKNFINAPDYNTFVNLTNSKRHTSSRIKRTMLYVLLQIR